MDESQYAKIGQELSAFKRIWR